MSAPEHSVNQFDVGSPIIDAITFDSAVNLTGATVAFVYRTPEASENTVRSATFSGASPSDSAATSVNARRNMSSEDAAEPGVYIYEWVFTLANGTVVIRPSSAPTTEFPDRKRPCFEVVESISATGGEAVDDGDESRRRIECETIAELRTFESLDTNFIAHVIMDSNGIYAVFKWDADATNADDGATYIRPSDFETAGLWVRIL